MTKLPKLPVALVAGALAALPVTMLPGAAANAAPAGSYTLGKVTFVGNSQVPSGELQSALPIQPGEKIDEAGMSQETDAVEQVYRKHNVGASLSIRKTITPRKVALLTYTFAEQAPVAPTVTHIGITADHVGVAGNKKISTDKILAAANLHPGDTLTNEKIAAAQTAILALYKKANVGATINSGWTNTTPQHVDLVFTVVEKTS